MSTAKPPQSPGTRPALALGRLGLGTWLFGWETPRGEAEALMRRALDQGIRYFDTASNYGSGASERIVGAYLKPVRGEVLIGTKVYAPFGPDPADRGLSARAVLRAVDGCLKRLGTDYIDLLHLHRPDPSVPEDETAGALGELIWAGKVRHVATSTFRGDQIDRLQRALRARSLGAAVLDQAPYSLLEREVEAAAADALRNWGMGLAVWSPLGEGLLTGKYDDSADQGRLRRWNLADQERFRRGAAAARELGALAAHHGLTLPQLALGWLRSRPLVTTVMIGARTVAQFDTYVDGDAIEVPREIGPQIDRIIPPGTGLLRHYET